MAIPDHSGPSLRALPLHERALLETLAGKLDRGTCLIFLGAGVAVDRAVPGLPTGNELSQVLATKCELEWHDYVPLSTTAFYYEFFYTREGLNDFVLGKLLDPSVQPSRTVRKLVEIAELLEQRGREVFIVTTNYDRQFEEAYRSRTGRYPEVIIYRGAEDPNRDVELHRGPEGFDPEFWRPTEARTYLYKMHGCISIPHGQGLVITEEDYINFLSNAQSENPKKRLAHEVRGRMASTILFLGYSLADWNFRVIFKATAERKRADQKESVAVRYFQPPIEPAEAERERQRWEAAVDFWLRKKVRIVNRDAFEFLNDLHRYLQGTTAAPAPSTPLA